MTEADEIISERCGNCRFFYVPLVSRNKPRNENVGQCRRYPPITSSSAGGLFVKVKKSDWCGEFKP